MYLKLEHRMQGGASCDHRPFRSTWASAAPTGACLYIQASDTDDAVQESGARGQVLWLRRTLF